MLFWRAARENPSRLCRQESTPRGTVSYATQATQNTLGTPTETGHFAPKSFRSGYLAPYFQVT